MNEKNDRYYIWMTQVLGIADPRIHQFTQKYGSPREAYEALSGKDNDILSDEEKARLDYITIEKADKLLDYCENKKISVCSFGSPEYPKLLSAIFNPPSVFFCRGDLSCLDAPCITFVGARDATAYIMKLCSRITRDIGQHGITVVSGMAHGVDECAHTACVNNGLRTVGVLACGTDYDYPFGSRVLREKIVLNGGAYISELLPNAPCTKEYFKARNRILAGLSRGTAVFQAAAGSGALITAAYAVNEGREVFCVPPPDIFDPRYQGVIDLLDDGAVPIFNHVDILKEYSLL